MYHECLSQINDSFSSSYVTNRRESRILPGDKQGQLTNNRLLACRYAGMSHHCRDTTPRCSRSSFVYTILLTGGNSIVRFVFESNIVTERVRQFVIG